MGDIPKDAAAWDGGDWIDWHRRGSTAPHLCVVAAQDNAAQLAVLRVSLIRAAKSHFQLTGEYLPVMQAIAHAEAAHDFDIPLRPEDSASAGNLVLCLPPDAESRAVEIDLSVEFRQVVVVRIDKDFGVESRVLPRHALPRCATGRHLLRWRDMPRRR